MKKRNRDVNILIVDFVAPVELQLRRSVYLKECYGAGEWSVVNNKCIYYSAIAKTAIHKILPLPS